MEKRHKAEMISITLVAAEVGSSLAKYSNGGYNMDGLTIAEVLKNIVDIGITPVLLVIFIVFFIRRANDDDARVKQAYSDAQKKIEDCNREVKERENTLNSMDAITQSLSKIEISLNKMESRHEQDITQLKDQMDVLEHKIDHMGGS